MKRLFIDTGAFIARELPSDQYHLIARRCWEEIKSGNYQLVSSEHVFDESVTLLARRTNYAWAAGWGNDLLEANIEWLQTDASDLPQALTLMRKFADQGVSFTDCISAVLMKGEKLKRVFGFDRHFENMGFHIWPTD